MWVKPRKLKVSGFPSPRLARSIAAKRPNSIKRVFSGWSDSEKLLHSHTQRRLEALSVFGFVEADNNIVGVPNQDHVTPSMTLAPLVVVSVKLV
jgi:hypothetical protein